MLVRTVFRGILFVSICVLTQQVHAGLVTVVNSSFEDISGESQVNEFTFGPFNGWDLYDPGGITGGGAGGTYFIGTLDAGPPWFAAGAPDGERVAIAFNFFGSGGQGEYGLQQTLSDTLEANTRYELSVEIGNIDEGTAQNGGFFPLQGFPGYRVDLLAGGVVIAQDNNTLSGTIPDGEFATSTIVFESSGTHTQLGEQLSIRLVNLNEIDPAFPNSDLEVDFDNVRLFATSVPEPNVIGFAALLFGAIAPGRRRRNLNRR